MKTLKQIVKKIALGAAAAVVLFCRPASAQIWYSFNQLSGTNFAPILQNFTMQTNMAYGNQSQHSLMVTNINTNEAITVAYCYQPSGQAATNPMVTTSFTTNFLASAGWTNGATWIYTFPPNAMIMPVTPWGMLCISNGQFTSGTCTNGVLFE